MLKTKFIQDINKNPLLASAFAIFAGFERSQKSKWSKSKTDNFWILAWKPENLIELWP
jgi:hypothetical protein